MTSCGTKGFMTGSDRPQISSIFGTLKRYSSQSTPISGLYNGDPLARVAMIAVPNKIVVVV